MNNRIVTIALLSCSSLPLAACGGGGGGGVASTSPPLVSTPTPTPAPASTYQTVAQLSQNSTMAAAGYRADNLDPRGTGTLTYYQFPQAGGNTVAYSNAGATLTLKYGTQTLQFDTTKPVNAGERRYAIYDDRGSMTAQALLITPKVNGVALTYVDWASLAAMETDANGRSTGYVNLRTDEVFGSPTKASDMPISGSATYATSVDGIGTLVGSPTPSYLLRNTATATFGIDFGSGNINTSIHVLGEALAGSGGNHDFGTLTGRTVLRSGSSAFGGDFGSSLYGRFEGGFFGPAAKEMAYAWFAQTPTWEARGIVAGVKN